MRRVVCICLMCLGFGNQGDRAAHAFAGRPGDVATSLAEGVLNARRLTLVGAQVGAAWQEMQKGLDALFANPTPPADEAVVILMSFYLGEHYGEQLQENLLSRGVRMLPLLEKYSRQGPTELSNRYPKAMRLERATTVKFLDQDIQVLESRSGAHKPSRITVETAPLKELSRECSLKLEQQPEPHFPNRVIRPAESYSGAPVYRVTITEQGHVTDVEQISRSGIERVDAAILAILPSWHYAQRPNCGSVQANIVVSIAWSR